MLDHLGFSVADYEKSKAFYLTALAPLGYELIYDMKVKDGEHLVAGFGVPGSPDFWISWLKEGKEATSSKSDSALHANTNVHVAFRAKSQEEVDQFYEAAIKAGGRDNGKPGIRAHYHPNYYGAFVYDLDGNNIEAVFHGPQSHG